MRRVWYVCLMACILVSHTSCRRPVEMELPNLVSNELPRANEYAIHVREPTKPEQTICKPFTGSETVLDVLGPLHQQQGSLAQMDIWLVRQGANGEMQLLKVDWFGITQGHKTDTNFLLCAGDRLILQGRFGK